MASRLKMRKRVRGVVAAAPDIPTYQTDPEIGRRTADTAFIIRAIGVRGGGESEGVVLRVPAYGTAATAPFFETGAVEDMLAEDCEETGCLVHALEADRTGREFDKGRCRRRQRFGGEGRC